VDRAAALTRPAPLSTTFVTTFVDATDAIERIAAVLERGLGAAGERPRVA
jgi:hypothetical protein